MKNDYDTDLDVMFCRSYGSADDPVSCVESDGKEKQGRAVTPGVAESRKTAKAIGNTNRTNRIIDFKSNALETWCVILVSES